TASVASGAQLPQLGIRGRGAVVVADDEDVLVLPVDVGPLGRAAATTWAVADRGHAGDVTGEVVPGRPGPSARDERAERHQRHDRPGRHPQTRRDAAVRTFWSLAPVTARGSGSLHPARLP